MSARYGEARDSLVRGKCKGPFTFGLDRGTTDGNDATNNPSGELWSNPSAS